MLEIESSMEENKAERWTRERNKEWGANTGPEDVVRASGSSCTCNQNLLEGVSTA